MSKKTKKNNVTPEKEVVEVEDRSDFNCKRCDGSGLMLNGVVQSVCDICNGTGKV